MFTDDYDHNSWLGKGHQLLYSENNTTELHYESQQTQFPAAEGLFDLAAFKLSLLFSMTTSVHSSASSDLAEAWMNNPFNTQHSIYSQHQHCTLDHHSLSISYNTALLFVSSLVLPELLIAIFWNQECTYLSGHNYHNRTDDKIK